MKCRKICNWSQYNRALINRGSLTFWISEDVQKVWKSSKKTNKPGRPEKYSDDAIKAICMVRFFFHLPLRATEGFITSFLSLMNPSLEVPSYSIVDRRMNSLEIDYRKLSTTQPLHLVIDATGVKVWGDGEWFIKIHGEGRKKKWRKMTLGVCPKTHEILFNITSDDSFADATLFKMCLELVPRSVKEVLMDGAGDVHEIYKQAKRKNIKLITPPSKGSKYRIGKDRTRRDEAVQFIYKSGNNEAARQEWKKRNGYHQRSLVETAISRFKGILGDHLKSRLLMNQHQEMLIKTLIINQINRLGLPTRL